jgi:hypothetical protein
LTKNDEIIGQAELAWAAQKVALFCQQDLSEKVTFEQEGWQCFADPMTQDLINELSVSLGEQ